MQKGTALPVPYQRKVLKMSKKIMLLALAAASVAMFALPPAASALELHLTNVTSFSGSAGAGSLTAEAEPVITCESGHVAGTVDPGGTTGTMSLDFTGCHTSVLGITAVCHTTGAPNPPNNTINTSGTFHLITVEPEVPAILVTPAVTNIVCAGISNTITGGNVIGTITDTGTSLTCNRESTELVTTFKATGSVQEHRTYTGTNYNLTAQTAGGSAKQAGLVATGKTKSSTIGKLDCT
jgi:hypothetical protein